MSASPARNPVARDLAILDPVWSRLRAEAEELLHTEPQLASFIVATVLNHTTLEGAVAHRVAARLGHPSLPAELIAHAFHEAITIDPAIIGGMIVKLGSRMVDSSLKTKLNLIRTRMKEVG